MKKKVKVGVIGLGDPESPTLIVDPKVVEKSSSLLYNIVNKMDDAIEVLNDLFYELDEVGENFKRDEIEKIMENVETFMRRFDNDVIVRFNKVIGD
jgi:hypothetical protein